jgi:MYXO-CTERM domain-containing protein
LVTTGDATLNFTAAALDPVDSMYKSPYTLTFGGSNLTSTWRFAYEGGVVAAATPGDASFISQTQVMRNGQLHWALVFDGGGSGGVSEGGTFTSSVVLAGQWSRTRTGAGSVELSYNSAYYTIASNFLYDGANTTFAVTTNEYVTTPDGEGNNPTIQMTLIGDVVPSPGAVALMGLAGVVGARRRR